jgi:hypothetical protein
MKRPSSEYSKISKIQWSCLLVYLLGIDRHLRDLTFILSGYESIEKLYTDSDVGKITAIRNVRGLFGNINSPSILREAVYGEEKSTRELIRFFSVDITTLDFELVYEGQDEEKFFEDALSHLQIIWDYSPRKIQFADPSKRLRVKYHEIDFPIDLHKVKGISQDWPRLSMEDRNPLPEIMIQDLKDLAAKLDKEDRKFQRRSRHWTSRFTIALELLHENSVSDVEKIRFDQITNLVGIPGSGKSTLIQLICIFLGRHELSHFKLAVLLPSILVAREYYEVFTQYSVASSILTGSSPGTRQTHANSMAQMLAAKDQRGFGETLTGAELFSTLCPLPAFSPTIDSWPENFKPGNAPCQSIYEYNEKKQDWNKSAKACPLWGMCPVVKNLRVTAEARVVCTHVLSLDTKVPAQICDSNITYIEYFRDHFDLVIFDESDIIQKNLDDQANVSIPFTGNGESRFTVFNKYLSGVLEGEHGQSDYQLSISGRINRFTRELIDLISFLQRSNSQFILENADALLSDSFLLNRFHSFFTTAESNSFPFIPFLSLWKTIVYRVAFIRRGDESDIDQTLNTIAHQFFEDSAQVTTQFKSAEDLLTSLKAITGETINLLRDYINSDERAEKDELFEQFVKKFSELYAQNIPDKPQAYLRLLAHTAITIVQFQKVNFLLNSYLLSGWDKDDLIIRKITPELASLSPLSLMGAFSALRYHPHEKEHAQRKFDLDFIQLTFIPRLLPQRMSRYGGVPVLLCSATSWFPDSSEHHHYLPPKYLLYSKKHSDGEKIIHRPTVNMAFSPVYDKTTGKALRFSGAAEHRLGNLKKIVEHFLYSPDNGLNEIQRNAISKRTKNGRRRITAFVVNSYAQVELLCEYIYASFRDMAPHIRGVVRSMSSDIRNIYILKGQVESIANDEDILLLIFPMAALGRGVNIVFSTEDEDNTTAAIGSVYFLTRPHPAIHDTSLLTSIIAQKTEEFDQLENLPPNLFQMKELFVRSRKELKKTVYGLLRHPLQYQRLSAEVRKTFAANLAVHIIQTIGRGIRGGADVDVYFVDAAWAPNSAAYDTDEIKDTESTSVLVQIQQLFRGQMLDAKESNRELSEKLYDLYRDGFLTITNLHSDYSGNNDHVEPELDLGNTVDIESFYEDGEYV